MRFACGRALDEGDQFVISNRTIDSYGTYTGEKDTSYAVEILNDGRHDLPTFHRSSSGSTTGLQAKLNVIGNYTGNSTFVFEVKIVTAGNGELSYFTWRKYLHGHADGGGPFSSYYRKLSLSPVALEDGISVSWAAISGQSVGDTWRFTAHAGDTFRWQQNGGQWSPPQRISNIGLVEADASNVGSRVVNVDIQAMGDYEGKDDATIVIEVLAGGSSFRWKRNAYLPLAGAYNTTGTSGPYCCGTEDVMYDSNLVNGVGKLKDGLGLWSPPINMMATVPIHLENGIHIMFAKTLSGYVHGDIYYIPVKQTRHHKMSHGVHLAFGSSSGYSSGDMWTLTATAAVAARGPLSGNTEIIVKGSGFLPTSSLRCRLTDPRTLHTMMLPARYISSEEVHCDTVGHPPDSTADPVFHGAGNSKLFTHGIFTGEQTSMFTIRMVSATTFQWRVDPVGSDHDRTAGWSGAKHISPGFIHSIKQGFAIRFSSVGGYLPGDRWTVISHYIDLSQANEHPEVQMGSIRPGVMKYVSVSNDGGSSWSVDQHGMTRFLFSDVYVSPSGDDVTGDGTSALPYRTIQRGIHAALSSPR